MPESGKSGLAATAIIRAKDLQTGQDVPIVAMTADAMKGDRERSLGASRDDYISKPIRLRQVHRLNQVAGVASDG